jgi:hypothetical protein
LLLPSQLQPIAAQPAWELANCSLGRCDCSCILASRSTHDKRAVSPLFCAVCWSTHAAHSIITDALYSLHRNRQLWYPATGHFRRHALVRTPVYERPD